jgi:hypothetical protein
MVGDIFTNASSKPHLKSLKYLSTWVHTFMHWVHCCLFLFNRKKLCYTINTYRNNCTIHSYTHTYILCWPQTHSDKIYNPKNDFLIKLDAKKINEIILDSLLNLRAHSKAIKYFNFISGLFFVCVVLGF